MWGLLQRHVAGGRKGPLPAKGQCVKHAPVCVDGCVGVWGGGVLGPNLPPPKQDKPDSFSTG